MGLSRPAIFLLAVAMVLPVIAACDLEEASQNEALPTVPAGPAESAPELADAVTVAINEIRADNGLQQLSVDESLVEVATNYSCRMAEEGFFSHSDPSGNQIDDRMMAAGIAYRQVGENLAQNTNAEDPAEVAVEGWMESPGHRENILRQEFELTGVGACRTGETFYFTQLFVEPPE